MRLVASGAEAVEDGASALEGRLLGGGEGHDDRGLRRTRLADPHDTFVQARQRGGAGFVGQGGGQFGHRRRFGRQPQQLGDLAGGEAFGRLSLRVAAAAIQAADHGQAHGLVVERNGEVEHLLHRAGFARLRDQRGEGLDDETGAVGVGGGRLRGDELGDGGLLTAHAGEGALAHQSILAMGHEQLGQGLFGVGRARRT